MIDFYKNELINEVLHKYYETFSYTLDTADYVPEKFNMKILKYIYKNMKSKFREIDKHNKKYVSSLKKKEKSLLLEEKEKNKVPKMSFKKFFKNAIDFNKKKKGNLAGQSSSRLKK